MEIIYRANDGTEFKSEQECCDYELKTADFFKECANVLAYDDRGYRVNFNKFEMKNMDDALENIWYIQFNSQLAIDLFRSIGLAYIEDDLCEKVQVGKRYYYDVDEGTWFCLENLYKKLDEVAETFN